MSNHNSQDNNSGVRKRIKIIRGFSSTRDPKVVEAVTKIKESFSEKYGQNSNDSNVCTKRQGSESNSANCDEFCAKSLVLLSPLATSSAGGSNSNPFNESKSENVAIKKSYKSIKSLKNVNSPSKQSEKLIPTKGENLHGEPKATCTVATDFLSSKFNKSQSQICLQNPDKLLSKTTLDYAWKSSIINENVKDEETKVAETRHMKPCGTFPKTCAKIWPPGSAQCCSETQSNECLNVPCKSHIFFTVNKTEMLLPCNKENVQEEKVQFSDCSTSDTDEIEEASTHCSNSKLDTNNPSDSVTHHSVYTGSSLPQMSPVDILLHQDKINILRQMSQVFNNEHLNTDKSAEIQDFDNYFNVVEEIDLYQMEKDMKHQVKRDELSCSDVSNDSLEMMQDMNDISRPSLNLDGNPINKNGHLNYKEEDQSTPGLQSTMDTRNSTAVNSIIKTSERVHLVPECSALLEEELIHVASIKGNHGEQIDIIDGFTFVSFDSENELQRYGHTQEMKQLKQMLISKKREKARKEAAKEQDLSDGLQSGEDEECSHKIGRNPDSCHDESTGRSFIVEYNMGVMNEGIIGQASSLEDCSDILANANVTTDPELIYVYDGGCLLVVGGSLCRMNVSQIHSVQGRVILPRNVAPLVRLDNNVKAENVNVNFVEINENMAKFAVTAVKNNTEIQSENYANKNEAVPKLESEFRSYNKNLGMKFTFAKKGQLIDICDIIASKLGVGKKLELESWKDSNEMVMPSGKITIKSDKSASGSFGHTSSSESKDFVGFGNFDANKSDSADVDINKSFKKHASSFLSLSQEVNHFDTKESKKLDTAGMRNLDTSDRKILDTSFLIMDELESNEPQSESVATVSVCNNEFCILGCVCDSLQCAQIEKRNHCARIECMFDCTCNYKEGLLKSNLETDCPGSDFRCTLRDSDMHQHESEMSCLGMKRKLRERKVPVRYRDSSFSWTDDVKDLFDTTHINGNAKGIIAGNDLHMNNFDLVIPWYDDMHGISVWCMDHCCYDCNCLKEIESTEEYSDEEEPAVDVTYFEQENELQSNALKCIAYNVDVTNARSQKKSFWLIKHWVHHKEKSSARTCAFDRLNIKEVRKEIILTCDKPEDTIHHIVDIMKNDNCFLNDEIYNENEDNLLEHSKEVETTLKHFDDIESLEPVKKRFKTGSNVFHKQQMESMAQHIRDQPPSSLLEMMLAEERRGELELDLSCCFPGNALLVAESRFRKLINMNIIGIVGLNKTGRCIVSSVDSSQTLERMQQMLRLISRGVIDVGPNMQDIFFSADNPLTQLRYIMIRGDQNGKWEIVGVVQRKASDLPNISNAGSPKQMTVGVEKKVPFVDLCDDDDRSEGHEIQKVVTLLHSSDEVQLVKIPEEETHITCDLKKKVKDDVTEEICIELEAGMDTDQNLVPSLGVSFQGEEECEVLEEASIEDVKMSTVNLIPASVKPLKILPDLLPIHVTTKGNICDKGIASGVCSVTSNDSIPSFDICLNKQKLTIPPLPTVAKQNIIHFDATVCRSELLDAAMMKVSRDGVVCTSQVPMQLVSPATDFTNIVNNGENVPASVTVRAITPPLKQVLSNINYTASILPDVDVPPMGWVTLPNRSPSPVKVKVSSTFKPSVMTQSDYSRDLSYFPSLATMSLLETQQIAISCGQSSELKMEVPSSQMGKTVHVYAVKNFPNTTKMQSILEKSQFSGIRVLNPSQNSVADNSEIYESKDKSDSTEETYDQSSNNTLTSNCAVADVIPEVPVDNLSIATNNLGTEELAELQQHLSAVDLSLGFKCAKLVWLVGTIRRNVLLNIFNTSKQSRTAVTLKVRNGNSTCVIFGRAEIMLTCYGIPVPILLVGSTLQFVMRAMNISKLELLANSSVKYLIQEPSFEISTFVYNNTGRFLVKLEAKRKCAGHNSLFKGALVSAEVVRAWTKPKVISFISKEKVTDCAMSSVETTPKENVNDSSMQKDLNTEHSKEIVNVATVSSVFPASALQCKVTGTGYNTTLLPVLDYGIVACKDSSEMLTNVAEVVSVKSEDILEHNCKIMEPEELVEDKNIASRIVDLERNTTALKSDRQEVQNESSFDGNSQCFQQDAKTNDSFSGLNPFNHNIITEMTTTSHTSMVCVESDDENQKIDIEGSTDGNSCIIKSLWSEWQQDQRYIPCPKSKKRKLKDSWQPHISQPIQVLKKDHKCLKTVESLKQSRNLSPSSKRFHHNYSAKAAVLGKDMSIKNNSKPSRQKGHNHFHRLHHSIHSSGNHNKEPRSGHNSLERMRRRILQERFTRLNSLLETTKTFTDRVAKIAILKRAAVEIDHEKQKLYQMQKVEDELRQQRISLISQFFEIISDEPVYTRNCWNEWIEQHTPEPNARNDPSLIAHDYHFNNDVSVKMQHSLEMEREEEEMEELFSKAGKALETKKGSKKEKFRNKKETLEMERIQCDFQSLNEPFGHNSEKISIKDKLKKRLLMRKNSSVSLMATKGKKSGVKKVKPLLVESSAHGSSYLLLKGKSSWGRTISRKENSDFITGLMEIKPKMKRTRKNDF